MAGGMHLGLQIAFYLYPCGLFVSLLGAQAVQFRRERQRRQDDGKERQNAPAAADNNNNSGRIYTRLIWFFQLLLSIASLLTIILVVHHIFSTGSDDEGQNDGSGRVEFPVSAYIASYVAVLLYFLAGLLPDPEGPWVPTICHASAWVVGVLFEAVIAALFLSEKTRLRISSHLLEDMVVPLGFVRIAILVIMTGAILLREFGLPRLFKTAASEAGEEERQSLLHGEGNGGGNGAAAGYGGVPPHAPKAAAPRQQVQGTGWLDYFAGFKILFPYLWPKDSPAYQAIVVVCLCLLVLQRIVNVLAPVQLGTLVDALQGDSIPYREIVLYVVYRALQGNQGALGAARSVLWIPVSQSLFRRLSCAAFEHVLGLSLDFHLNKKIGEVTSALSRGAAMNTFLESFCFQVFPMVFDIFVAGVFFFVKYDAFYTIIVFFIMWSYIFLTIYVAKYRGKQRRDMATKSREMEAIKTDAILAYETVQHNCAVAAETDRFKQHVVFYQQAERLVQWSLNGLNLTQSSIFSLGTALLVAVSAYKIHRGEQTVGEFVSLINYFVQLQGPLNFFGTYYTMLQNNLIEAERMLDLFKETPGIVEKPDAIPLPPSPKGEVAFSNVRFSYRNSNSKKDEQALNGVNFTVPPGTKTAIVGESGSGKSTCLKLLYRFYDAQDGAVIVDGHDIKDLKLDSFRKSIGVVPQDTVLFNATIMYNLLYANPGASEAEVFDACSAANIHHRILEFPDGYQTKVGERGLKLSGGERQRIAIARAILKDAKILLLDEATASLDSHTERQIQDALERVTEGRTTITIAHRLSTITTSDQIVVLHKGTIVERGTHEELLSLGGRYQAMWEKQTVTEQKKKQAEKAEKVEGEGSETSQPV